MATKKGNIRIKGDRNIVGDRNVVIDKSVNIENSSFEIDRAFSKIYDAAANIKNQAIRKDTEDFIQRVEKEVKQGDQADISSIERWLGFLADIAPDIWEVAVDTLSNPIKGVSTVVQKIAAKAKSQSH